MIAKMDLDEENITFPFMDTIITAFLFQCNAFGRQKTAFSNNRYGLL